jgi:cell division septation protein DedD
MVRCIRIWSVSLASVICIVAATLPAHADRIEQLLTEANKKLEQGAPAKTIELVNLAIKSGQLPAENGARALLLRARAYEALDKYAYALADYNQAIWMKSLPATDKAEAELGRTQIMEKLGVAESPSGKGARPTQSAARATPEANPARAPAPSAAAWTAAEQDVAEEERPAPSGGIGSIGGLFSGLFGSSDRAEAQPRVQSIATPPVQTIAAQQPSPQAPAKPRPPAAVAQARSEPGASLTSGTLDAGGEPSGDFAIQIAALHYEDKAISEVNRVQKRFAEWLGGRTPSIMVRETNDGGTLYKVIIKPYQRTEGVAACETLKSKGLNCMLISK